MAQAVVGTKSDFTKRGGTERSGEVKQDQRQAQEIAGLIAQGRAQDALDRGLDYLNARNGHAPAGPDLNAAVASACISVAEKMHPKTKEAEVVQKQLYEKALEHINYAEEFSDEPSPALYVLQGRAHAGLGEWIDAAKYFKFAVQQSPENYQEPLNMLFILAAFRATEEPRINAIIGHKEEIALLLNDRPERLWLKTIGILQEALRMNGDLQDGKQVLSVDRWALDLCRIAAHRFGKERELAAVLLKMETAGILDSGVNEYAPLTLKITPQLRQELQQQERYESSESAGNPAKPMVWAELEKRGDMVQPVNVNAARVGPANNGASRK